GCAGLPIHPPKPQAPPHKSPTPARASLSDQLQLFFALSWPPFYGLRWILVFVWTRHAASASSSPILCSILPFSRSIVGSGYRLTAVPVQKRPAIDILVCISSDLRRSLSIRSDREFLDR